MIDLLGWQEMNNVHLIRQGNNFVHIWKKNHMLLKKKKTINKHIHTPDMATGAILSVSNMIDNNAQINWDHGLDVSTAPKYGRNTETAEENMATGKP